MRLKTRTRQLANGKWIGEVQIGWLGRWEAVDAVSLNYTWLPGDRWFFYCQVEAEGDAKQAIAEHISLRYGI